ncbi:tRNA uridine(34) 5-carboxymethylaminomethyl modification radical SAM/GNAT enzyme Elp3 [Candidatus Parcubacteria bacterium]|nr:tRNA uridine(34) 5-carboxymethylaminomethyl modification radical SAM/GNAT enzyme Elp3 [Candidatus Parcubacteria bacterium]
MKKNTNQKKQAIAELLASKIKSSKELMKVKRKIAKKYKVGIFSNPEILKELNSAGTGRDLPLRRLLRKRAVRTMSGIAPVAVLTKPYPCPGKCAYCPTEKGVPQSYLSNEPAVMRAIRCNYNPYIQVQDRLRALVANGHEPTKIELIVIGGTWSYLPKKYKYWYVLNLFAGANRFRIFNIQYPTFKQYSISNSQYPITLSVKKLKESLIIEQKRNEKAEYKIIGLTLETRPDYIDKKELLEMRELGCTRVEIGVQCLDDEILKLNKRGHGVKEIAEATSLLRQFGLKITYHIMPALPGSTSAKDLKMFKTLFSDERFQPDQIKFYPTVVTKGSLLYRWWKQGKYKPYSDKILRNLIIKCKNVIPEYVRVIRLIRDIPGESIIAGNLITNLRQVMKDEGVKCRCIRCREIKNYTRQASTSELRIKNYELKIIKYSASEGEEYFIQAVAENGKYLLGFCRLRLPHITQRTTHSTRQCDNLAIQQFNNTVLIRELHVYGELVSVSKDKKNKKVQHAGLGKKLLAEAEKIALENKYKKIAVISGIGVRGYYRKLGYRLDGTYMVKLIKN